jgi:nucleoid-associated protein YgaU
MFRIGVAVVATAVAIGSLFSLHPGLAPPAVVVAPEPAQAPVAVMTSVAPATPATPPEPTASRLKKLGQAKAPPEPSVDEVTDGVLADLGLKEPAPEAPEQAALRDMTSNVLKGLGAVTGKQVAPVAARPQGATLQSLVASALREGKPDAYIDMLVNAAAGRGEIRVPKALVTSEGRVDTAVLLADLITKATREAGGAVAAPTPAGGDGVELRVVQKADGAVEQYQFYTVQPGDSLGAISVKFYGDINRYMAVYEANRMILSSPDVIRVGQRLVIPAA